MCDAIRAEFYDSASADDFRELAKQPRLRVLQCSAPVHDAVWSLVNTHFCAARPDVLLRVYGHYPKECDLTFARLLTNVRHFAADCLMRATNAEAIAEIQGLESLSLGVFELTDFRVLERVSPGLTSLAHAASHHRHTCAAVRLVLRREETDCSVVGRPISTRKRLRKFFTRSIHVSRLHCSRSSIGSRSFGIEPRLSERN